MASSFTTKFWLTESDYALQEAQDAAASAAPVAFDRNESDPRWDPEAGAVGTFSIGGAPARVEIVNRLKSGKEATVYCCVARTAEGERLVAAKFFKDFDRRAFKNDAIYQEGRFRAGRPDRAFRGRTGFGRSVQFAGWVAREYEVLARLHAAGADVPRPYLQGERYVLMEYLGTAEASAPLLRRARLAPAQARAVFDRIIANVRLFLAHDVVHGDLSAFNILWDGAQGRIIDFPQSVDPRHNTSAFELLARDVGNVCRHFARYGVTESAADIATELWSEYVRRPR